MTSIFNYATGERLDILPDGRCQTLNLSQSAFDVFGFTELRASGRATLLPAADVFRFGDTFPKVFLGDSRVRGIPVYHWQSCQTRKSGDGVTMAAYVLDYFFSKPGHGTATSDTLIPVRALINGTALNVDGDGKPIGGTHDFSHVYDFSFFRPGPLEDESVFEVPRGTVCERSVSKTLPQLPDQFSLSMEVYVAGSARPPMTERMLFDYDFGLIQTDRFAPRGTGERFGLTQLTIVEDYKNHVQYVIDSFDGNCSVSPLPEGLSTSDGGRGPEITMKHGQQLLRYGQGRFSYQGQRRLRDMKVDVWAQASQSGMVQEVYFLAGWPSARLRSRLSMMNVDLDLSRMNILVGTYLLNTSAVERDVGPFFRLFGDRALKQWGDRWQRGGALSKSLPRPGDLLRQRVPPKAAFRWDSPRTRFPRASEKMINVFNYLPLHMDLSAFDVSMCYKKSAREMYVYFMLEGTYASVVTNQRYVFMSSTRAAVAKAAGVSTLRVAKVNVWQDLVSNRLNIFFSLLEPPPVAGAGEQLSCQAAYERLSRAVQAGLTITVRHPMKQTQLHVVSDSLKRWASLDELWNKVLPGSQPAAAGRYRHDGSRGPGGAGGTSGGGYTAGELGGTAFAMLLLGVLLGVAGVYVALRRLRPDIHLLPYQQSK